MMDKLIPEVRQLVNNEYERASDKYGPVNHSDHESYAIILEELQEAKYEVCGLENTLDKFWDIVKRDYSNQSKAVELCTMQTQALFAACELIQVAAMAYKALQTIYGRERDENLCGD